MKILLFVTCTALGGYYAKCNKTEIEILDVITSMWNLKNEKNWLILKKKKKKQSHRYGQETNGYQQREGKE